MGASHSGVWLPFTQPAATAAGTSSSQLPGLKLRHHPRGLQFRALLGGYWGSIHITYLGVATSSSQPLSIVVLHQPIARTDWPE